jgi:hypothetical protein
MIMRQKSVAFLIGLAVVILASAALVIAQDPPSQEQQQKEQAALEEKALSLLDQVIAEGQTLRLPENRIRVQFNAGDLLWKRDEGRARALFAEAAAAIAEMIQGIDSNDRQYFNLIQTPNQLRRDLLAVVARHDPQLAYSFLQATRLPPPPPNAPNFRGEDAELNLEMNLMAQIAATDPALALQSAEEVLSKGQYPSALARLLAELQRKDPAAAKKLSETLLKRLRADTLLAHQEAGSLALNLLRPGPRPAETPSGAAKTNSAAVASAAGQVLTDAAFRELMEAVITASLSATPRAAGGQRGQALARGAQNAGRGGQNNARGAQNTGRGGLGVGQGQAIALNAQGTRSAPSAEDNARSLLMGLQPLLPQIDKYLPARAPVVRQKLGEVGALADARTAVSEFNALARQGSVEDILQAAPNAPQAMQGRLYQQAAIKALNEGSPELARQIANERLEPPQRNTVLQALERQRVAQTALAGKIEEARQAVMRLRTDEERINLLTQLAASAAQANNQELAAQLLEDARHLVRRRAENYQQLDAQLRVARAHAGIDPARGFELLDAGIEQLNEMLPAAALLSGFEVRIFKDGELPLQGGSQLNNMIARYTQELAALARGDFARAEATASRFHRAEPRILARLSIVRGVLGEPAAASVEMPAAFGRGGGPGNRPGRPPQNE